MCIGEKRRLTIPSDMGYGDSGSGAKIPGGRCVCCVGMCVRLRVCVCVCVDCFYCVGCVCLLISTDLWALVGATLVFDVELKTINGESE
jgi:hypothetical protein